MSGEESGRAWTDPVALAALAEPSAAALVRGDRAVSYGQLDRMVGTEAIGLRARGVRPGDRIGVLARPDIGTAVAIHALARVGALAVILDPRLSEAHRGVQAGRARVAAVLDARPDPEDPGPSPAPLSDAPPPTRPAGEAGAVVFTSGTSGEPRGAVLTRAQLVDAARASRRRLGRDAGTRWVLCLPPSHVGGLSVLVRAALAGQAVLLPERPGLDGLLEVLHGRGATGASLVPTLLHRLLSTRPGHRPPGSLRCLLVGGGPVPDDLVARAREAGWPVAPTYGLTEAASQVATRSPPEVALGLGEGTAGRPLPGTRVRIVDERGGVVPDGVEGEIQVAGPTVFAGYLDDPSGTAATFQDGWLRTGDLGSRRGPWLVPGVRRSDLVVTGGENVRPAEVEAVMALHPAVVDAAVVGIPDPEWGQTVAAAVVTRGPAGEAEIVAWCRDRLPPWKVPRRVVLVADLPRTATGKVRRAVVADLFGALPDVTGPG